MHFKPEISSVSWVGVGVPVPVGPGVGEYRDVSAGVTRDGVERIVEPPAGVMVAGPRR